MTVIGIILIILGAGGCVYGITQNNSFEAQMDSLFSSGNIDPGTAFIVIGAILAVVGIILLVTGLSRKK